MFTYNIKPLITLFTLLLLNQKPNCRLILIFTNKANNASISAQLVILSTDPRGIAKRGIVIKTVVQSASNLAEHDKWHVSKAPFTVITIGPDNDEKLRSHQPVTLAKFYDLTDNAPVIKMVRYRNQ